MTRTEALEAVAEAARHVDAGPTAQHKLRAALAALDAAPTDDGWHSSNLPLIGEPVLIHIPAHDRRKVHEAVRHLQHEGALSPWWWQTASGEVLPDHVDAWRPIPPPPAPAP